MICQNRWQTLGYEVLNSHVGTIKVNMRDWLCCYANKVNNKAFIMNMKIDINDLTAYQEDYRIEAKAAKNQIPNNIWESYSSFANTEGGIILQTLVK